MKTKNKKLFVLSIFFLSLTLFSSSVFGAFWSDGFGMDKSPSEYDTPTFGTVLNFLGLCSPDKDVKAEEFGFCDDYDVMTGEFFSYVILPMLLAFFMFFAIMTKVSLFDKKSNRNISLVLALVMAPLGTYSYFFINVLSKLTGITVFILYIFLFIFFGGWGWKNLGAKGIAHIEMGEVHRNQAHRLKTDMQDIDGKINAIQVEIDELYKTRMKKLTALQKEDSEINITNAFNKIGSLIKKKSEANKSTVPLENIANEWTRLTTQIEQKEKIRDIWIQSSTAHHEGYQKQTLKTFDYA